jgi:hypothetical protein
VHPLEFDAIGEGKVKLSGSVLSDTEKVFNLKYNSYATDQSTRLSCRSFGILHQHLIKMVKQLCPSDLFKSSGKHTVAGRQMNCWTVHKPVLEHHLTLYNQRNTHMTQVNADILALGDFKVQQAKPLPNLFLEKSSSHSNEDDDIPVLGQNVTLADLLPKDY